MGVGGGSGDDDWGEEGVVVVGAASSTPLLEASAVGAPLLTPRSRRRLLTVVARSGLPLSGEDELPSGPAALAVAAAERSRRHWNR